MLQLKAILPDQPAVDPAALEKVIQNALDGAAMDIQVDFAVTVQTWNEKPEFKIEKPNPYERDIFTESEIYTYVNDGTPAHEILPVRAQALRFLTGGAAKTRPGYIGSNQGSLGTDLVFARRVSHPGIAPRAFDEAIANKWDNEFPTVLQRALDAAVPA